MVYYILRLLILVVWLAGCNTTYWLTDKEPIKGHRMARLTSSDLTYSAVARSTAFYAATAYLMNHPVSGMRSDIMVIVNMDEPSFRERLYVYDRNAHVFLGNYHVAHGIHSSDKDHPAWANSFSNTPDSEKSSIGAMITGDTYVGKHGLSLRLIGLEKGINDNVSKRDIVMHSADYMTNEFILSIGYAGRSWGCLALSPQDAKVLIPQLKEGVFIYVYHNER